MSAVRPRGRKDTRGAEGDAPCYTTNSHRTTITHKDTLAVTLGDPAEHAQHLRKSLGERVAEIVESVSEWVCLLGAACLLGTCALVLATLIGIEPKTDSWGAIALAMAGASVGLIVAPFSASCLADRLRGVYTRRVEQCTVITVPLGDPGSDPRRSAAVRSAFAERVTVEVRDQLQDMVVEGHEEEARKVLATMLESAEKEWAVEGEAQGKALAKMMKPA